MLKLYSHRRAMAVLDVWSAWIETLGRKYPLPPAALRAVLYQEIRGIDIFDPLADLTVSLNLLRDDLPGRFSPRKEETEVKYRRRGIFSKRDSSTGYAQIFAYVGVNAVRFALDRGLLPAEGPGLRSDTPYAAPGEENLKAVWRRSRSDPEFNMELCALNLLSAAEEMTGRIDFEGYTPGELMLVLSRYNSNTGRVTAYGQRTYGYYLWFREFPHAAWPEHPQEKE